MSTHVSEITDVQTADTLPVDLLRTDAGTKATLAILLFQCCPHIAALFAQMGEVQSALSIEEVLDARKPSLVVVGVNHFPERRMFIDELRRVLSDVLMVLLRKQDLVVQGEKGEYVVGEFLLSSQATDTDMERIKIIRGLFPTPVCSCMQKPVHSEIAKDAIKVISSQFSDADLNLEKVADQLPVTASALSRILNHEVGISFRTLLQQTRMDEAKRLLATHKYSIKQIAYSVGFSDSHYFSRCFKKVTGYKASEFTERVVSL